MRYGLIIAAVAMALAGCGQPQQSQTDTAVPDQQGCIQTRCVVTYHAADTSYWTEQRHRFCPASGLFEAGGTEPEGLWRCTFSKGQFSSSGLKGTYMKSLPSGLMDAALAELVYYSFTAGSGFEPSPLTAAESTSIQGQRYEAFQIPKTGADLQVMLYRNAVTGAYELVRLTEADGKDWMARSYNLRYNDRLKRMVPRTVDIYDIAQGIASKKLLIQFDYVDVK